ncbi:MAG TPA: PAS domain S-box protein [Pseudorhizobium sp.]|nr:PAS domain S-box protein [Pseudorhizobium sp.]
MNARSSGPASAGTPTFLSGGGEMGALMRAHDWSPSPLNVPALWPESLRTLVAVILGSKQPMFLTWGREQTLIHNDSYAEILAKKHPLALGRPFLEVWSEIRADLAPIIERAYAGEPVHMDDITLLMQRKGYLEETHFSFSYTPVRSEAGDTIGVFCACTETTAQVLAEAALRESEARLSFLDRLGAETASLSSAGAVLATTTRLLGEHLNLSVCAYADMDEDQDGFTIRGDWAAQGASSIVGHYSLADFGTLAVKNLGAGLPLVVNDNLHELAPEEAATFQNIGIAATICMPLVKEGRLTALMAIHDRSPRVWTESELSLLHEITARSWAHVERVQSNAALQASEARLAAIFAEAPVGLSEIGLDGRFQSVNAELCGILGRSREEVLSGRMTDVTLPEDVSQSRENFERTIGTGEPVSFDKRYVRPDGTIVWANSNLTRLDDEEGKPRGVLAVTVDLTDRHLQQAALHEETHTLETLNRTGATLAGELDLDRLLQIVTDAAVELTGAKFGAYFHNVMDETGERLHLYTLSGADRAAFESMGRPRATAIFGPTFRNETIIRSPDILADPRYGRNAPHKGMPEGHLPVRSYLAIPVVSSSGQVLGGLIFGHPEPGRFTARHERLMTGLAAQAAIAIDNARLFQAVQVARETLEQRVEERTAERNRIWSMSRDLFAVMGFDGHLKAINPAWEKTLGFSSDILLGRPFPEQVHPDDHRAVEAVVERLRRGEVIDRFEDRLRHADGSWRWIAWGLVPEGDVFYAVGRDITGDKEAAAELEAAQEALRQSQKMEAVGQLTGGLAHDFNNLLAGISGSLELIGTRIAQGRVSDVDRYLLAAQGAAKRAAALTHRLLAFSRRQTLDPKPTDVNQLVAGMEELVRRTVGPQVEIEAVAKAGLWPVLADPNQLENALLNLCINARDAMPDGGKIIIETGNRWLDDRAGRERDLPPGQYVSLCVSDNGTGMPDDVIERAFDPFFTTKPIGVGTGLGLSMIYGFARQSGGQVRIYSEVGQGTMVCIYLPRHHAGEVDADKLATATPLERAEAGETVLVIDDEPLVRMLIVDVLEELGYAALEAGDGPEGLKVLRSDVHLDLLITDVGLPNGMNGRQVADAARELRPNLKILFVTGYAENAVLSHGHLDAGMQVVTKPFDMAELARRIKSIIAE